MTHPPTFHSLFLFLFFVWNGEIRDLEKFQFFLYNYSDKLSFCPFSEKFKFKFFMSFTDIFVTGPNQQLITKLISYLNVVFSLKDLGALHYFLGIEVHRTATALYLSQSKYIIDLLLKTNMEGAKPSWSPAKVFPKLAIADSASFEDYITIPLAHCNTLH